MGGSLARGPRPVQSKVLCVHPADRILSGMSGRESVDARSREFDRLTAEKLEADPQRLAIARDNLRRWMQTGSASSRPLFEQWSEILDRPLPAILEILRSDDPAWQQLRQCIPFAGILSNEERTKILMRYRKLSPDEAVFYSKRLAAQEEAISSTSIAIAKTSS